MRHVTSRLAWRSAARLLLTALALTVILVAACTRADAGAVNVVSVTDGDTIRVVLQGREEPVRLIGIDTPELRPRPAPFARQAHSHLRELLSRRRVWLEFDATERDRYGRMLAYVWLKPPGAARDPRVDMVMRRWYWPGGRKRWKCGRTLSMPRSLSRCKMKRKPRAEDGGGTRARAGEVSSTIQRGRV